MPILCACPNGHSLRVKDKLAGKKGKCPTCGADFDVPALPTPPTEGGPPPLSIQPQMAVSPSSVAEADPPIEWRIARPNGEQFGPTVPTVFAQWIVAGRITPDTLVWRTGWPDWRRADSPNANLPAPLPVAQASPPAVPGVTLPPPLPPAPLVGSSAPTPSVTPTATTASTNAYNARRRQQAKRRRMITVVLALVCVVLAGLLVFMMSSSDTSNETKPALQTPPTASAEEPAAEMTP